MEKVTIKLVYPEGADEQFLAYKQEAFAREMEDLNVKVTFKGSLPRPRRPKNVQ